MKAYDMLTIGETMLRLTPPAVLRFEQAQQLDVWVGGSESNTAVGMARLGRHVAWISRLPSTALGRMVGNRIAQYGVDVCHVQWADASERLGLCFHEKAQAPRSSEIIYDRRGSAMSAMQPQQLPTQLFRAGKARLFHCTGITLAISESARATVHEALRLAKAARWRISFDSNFRSKLWTGRQAATHCHFAFSQADVIFCPHSDFRAMYGDAPPPQALEELAKRYPQAVVVMTMGRDGAIARQPSGECSRQPALLSSGQGRVGGGDAFAAGFLHHWLEQGNVADALRWGAAMAAMKYSIPGDLPLVDAAAVAALARGAQGGGLLR